MNCSLWSRRGLAATLFALGPVAWAASPTPLQTVTHSNAQRTFFIDARRTVAVDDDGAAAVVIPRSGPPRAVKFSGNGKLRSPLVTPDGRILAVGLDFPRCEVAVWDLGAGRKVTALRGDFTRIFGCGDPFGTEFTFNIQFTPDGRFLLSQDAAGLRRWDALTGRLLGARPGIFLNLAVSPDGRAVAALGGGHRVEVWASDLSRRLKATPPQPADCFRGPGAWPSEAAWSPDSTRVAFSCDREVRVWNVANGGLQSLKRGSKREYPDAPAFSPDGRLVVANEDQHGVAVWTVEDGQRAVQVSLKDRQSQVTDLGVTPSNVLYAALNNGQVLRQDLKWPAAPPTVWTVFPGGRSGGWPSLALSAAGDRLAVASGTGKLAVFALP